MGGVGHLHGQRVASMRTKGGVHVNKDWSASTWTWVVSTQTRVVSMQTNSYLMGDLPVQIFTSTLQSLDVKNVVGANVRIHFQTSKFGYVTILLDWRIHNSLGISCLLWKDKQSVFYLYMCHTYWILLSLS
jgi:hypothetical protein